MVAKRENARPMVARSAHTMTFRQQAEESGKPSVVPEWALDLVAKEFRFLMEYVIDMDARQAVVRCGFAQPGKEAIAMSARYMANEQVKEALNLYLMEGNESRRQLRNRIIEELAALSFYETGDYVQIRKNTLLITNTDELTVQQMKAFKRLKQTRGKSPAFEIEFHDKIKAMELLDRMTGGQAGGGNTTFNVNGNNIGIAVQMTPDEASIA
jgi:hypothetical protein